jgi:hypothetical protein
MTSEEFRRIALGLPEAIESEHMSHPDFRIRGKIFATLFADETRGVVLLTPEGQAAFIERDPEAFAPAKGAWGRRGSTTILLATVSVPLVESALALAWIGKAPKRLAAEFSATKRGGDGRPI